jgi:hypothetical protein
MERVNCAVRGVGTPDEGEKERMHVFTTRKDP